MNKEQQIEEMAVIGCVRNPQAHTAEECAKCDFKNGQCNSYRHAEALYNAGYRKTFTSDFASDTQKAYKEGYIKGFADGEEEFEIIKNRNAELIKERDRAKAVKEFAEKLKKRSYCDNHFMDGKWHRYVFVDEIDELLKEYEK